jgi:class 3 adenylate cyclase/tetratricopeptide (TPR) repeat protein
MSDTVNTCGDCGLHNASQARYCESCGISLREHCPGCGASVRAHQKFCRDCGQSLTGLQRGVFALDDTEQPLDGERKFATVLFADIANSTELIMDRDAEEANHILEPTVKLMSEAVRHFDGRVIREQGDGVMATFGAPRADEDHAVKACYAALRMQDAMRSRAAEVRREFGLFLQVRVGINSGPVVVTLDDRVVRVDGLATHVAARLESLAAPGTIVLSRDTLVLAEGFVHVGEIERVSLKGVKHPVDVCELKGVNTRIRMQALAARGLSKFVGRRAEMELLGRAAAEAQAGHGQVVALVGEAGVGKSRLLWEFTRSPAIQNWLVLEAGSVSYGKATSYLPLVELLTRYFGIQPRDDERRVREKIAGKLFALGEKKLLEQLPLFLGALAIGVHEPEWTSLTPAERQSEMFAALKHLLIRESQEQPLCVLFEDLHWIDAETQTFLDMLLESVPAARLLLLVDYRPDYESRWARKTYYSQARIDALPAASADELLEALLGAGPELGPIKRALVEATDGNPLFLEESVRSLIESGVLVGSAGQWRPIGSLPAVFVPRTIEALLAARIDRLQPRYKELLQCAAVIGNDVPQALLEALTGLSHEELERSVTALQAAEFLYEKTLFPETEYTFKHSMTREVAYASLLRERKMALHARAAHALVALATARIDEHVERVAQHAEQGGLWEMALQYLERSGAKAFSLYANSEAAGFFERALKALKHLPETRAALEHAVDVRFELRNALLLLGETDRILQSLQEIEPLLAGLGDRLRSARYAAFRCNHHFLAGEQRRAIGFGESGRLLAREGGDRRIEGELLYRLGQSYHALGEYRTAIDLLEQSLPFTDEKFERNRVDLTVIPAVVSRYWLVIALSEWGDFVAAMSHAKRALEIAEHAEHPLSEVLGWLAVGSVLLRKGEFEGAVGDMERAMALCDRWSMRVWRPRVASSLSIAYGRVGRVEEGLDLARNAVTDAERMRLTVDRIPLLVRLGQAALIAGRVDEALAHGRNALDLAVAHEAKGSEAWAHFLMARAYWAASPQALDDSERALEPALALATTCEARPLVAFCTSAFAAIYGARGDESRAQGFAAAANATYAALGMRPLPLHPVN